MAEQASSGTMAEAGQGSSEATADTGAHGLDSVIGPSPKHQGHHGHQHFKRLTERIFGDEQTATSIDQIQPRKGVLRSRFQSGFDDRRQRDIQCSLSL